MDNPMTNAQLCEALGLALALDAVLDTANVLSGELSNIVGEDPIACVDSVTLSNSVQDACLNTDRLHNILRELRGTRAHIEESKRRNAQVESEIAAKGETQ